jgi:hypothetical protein
LDFRIKIDGLDPGPFCREAAAEGLSCARDHERMRMSTRADISVMAIAILAIANFVDHERANATSVVTCEPVTLAPADQAQVDDLAKHLVAPQLLDESKYFYCKHGARTIAVFQTVPVLAADGASETEFLTCHRDDRWKCDRSRERAIEVPEAAGSEAVRIVTRDDLSAAELRELYAAALGLAGNDSTVETQSCHTPGKMAKEWRALFVQSHSRTIRVSRQGTLFDVERDHIEIELSVEEDAKGVKTMQYRCIVRWP